MHTHSIGDRARKKQRNLSVAYKIYGQLPTIHCQKSSAVHLPTAPYSPTAKQTKENPLTKKVNWTIEKNQLYYPSVMVMVVEFPETGVCAARKIVFL